MANLRRHVKNMQNYGLPIVVAINHFTSDTEAEIKTIQDAVAEMGVKAIEVDAWAKGGEGTQDLAKEVVELADQPADFHELYKSTDSIEDKLTAGATKIYGAKRVVLSNKAKKQIKTFDKQGWNTLPVCIAKTQYSFTDDQTKLGAPTDFDFHIRDLVPKLGAGFIVALSGTMMTMPGWLSTQLQKTWILMIMVKLQDYSKEKMAEVSVIMGSKSDWSTMKHACEILDQFSVSYDKRYFCTECQKKCMILPKMLKKGTKVILRCRYGSSFAWHDCRKYRDSSDWCSRSN